MLIPAEIFLTWRGCCCCCCCCWFTVCLVLPHGPARFLLLVLTSSLAHKWWVRNYDGDRFISGIFHCIRLTLGLKREHAENSIWICVCVCVCRCMRWAVTTVSHVSVVSSVTTLSPTAGRRWPPWRRRWAPRRWPAASTSSTSLEEALMTTPALIRWGWAAEPSRRTHPVNHNAYIYPAE